MMSPNTPREHEAYSTRNTDTRHPVFRNTNSSTIRARAQLGGKASHAPRHLESRLDLASSLRHPRPNQRHPVPVTTPSYTQTPYMKRHVGPMTNYGVSPAYTYTCIKRATSFLRESSFRQAAGGRARRYLIGARPRSSYAEGKATWRSAEEGGRSRRRRPSTCRARS